MTYRGLCVTGTDTGIGKTVVAGALVRLFREAGLRLGVLKPVETGCEGEALLPADGLLLARAAGLSIKGITDRGEDADAVALEEAVPWRFRAPLAPAAAARLEGLELGVDRIYQAMDRWMESVDLVIMETAGGIMVPLNPRFTFLDLVQGLALPVIVAAPNRLGVINHALLTLEAIKSRGLGAVGVVLCQLSPEPDPSATTNARMIETCARVPVYEVPFCAPPKADAESGDRIIERAAEALRPRFSEIRTAMQNEWARTAARYLGRWKPGRGGRR